MTHIHRYVLGAVALLLVAPAHGISQRTFVATYGSDASPNCSTVAPCRSFGAAIARTASGGEVVVLDSGGYGPVEITQSVSITSPEGVFAGISVLPGLTGIAVNGVGVDVTLRGLTVNGAAGTTYGIVMQEAARLHIDRCTVTNTSIGISRSGTGNLIVTNATIADNGAGVSGWRGLTTIVSSRVIRNETGIYGSVASGPPSFTPMSGDMAVLSSLVADNSADGIVVHKDMGNSYRMLVDASVSRANGGSGVLAVGVNLSIGPGASGWVFDSVLDGNGDGARADSVWQGGSLLTLWNNRISGNTAHGVFASAGIRATGNHLVGNATGMQTDPSTGTIYTAGNNEIPGSNPIQGNVVVQPVALY